MLEFEHLVEINDPANPGQELLSREELWFGLLCRAEDACIFLPGLESCRIVERGAGALVRELDFGSTMVRDKVTFHPMEWICFEVEASEEHPGGKLTITIEEPCSGALFLRFSYRTSLADEAGTESARYADFVRSAYYQSDLDTVRIIRRIAGMSKSAH